MLKSVAFDPVVALHVVPDFGTDFALASRNREFRRPGTQGISMGSYGEAVTNRTQYTRPLTS